MIWCITIFDPRFDTNLDFLESNFTFYLCNISITSVYETRLIVSEAQYWETEPVWMDEPAAHMEGVSDDCTGPLIILINRNVPQSNVTEANKSNVVTVTVFGDLYEEKDTTDIVEKRLSSRLSYRLSYRLLVTFLPEKQRLSPAKSFNSLSVCDEKKIKNLCDRQPSDRDRGYTLPSRLFRSRSAGFLCEFMAVWWRSFALCESPLAENWRTMAAAFRRLLLVLLHSGSASLWVDDH